MKKNSVIVMIAKQTGITAVIVMMAVYIGHLTSQTQERIGK